MSLLHMIQYDNDWKNFFKETIPRKENFKTISGHKAFSKEYNILAKYMLSDRNKSCVVGMGFDYMARWMIAREVKDNSSEPYMDLIAEESLDVCKKAAKEKKININKLYDKSIDKCRDYVDGYIGKDEIIKVAIFFAKLEQIFRGNVGESYINIDYVLDCEEDIVEDLAQLYDVFENRFINSDLITENSCVVYNPHFGGASSLCNGADADIYIDGTLYDFKCTKKHGYAWNEVAQIVGYFLLDSIAKKNNDKDNSLKDNKIDRIAFYRARYGEIEYVDIANMMNKNLVENFENIIHPNVYKGYKKYLENERKREKRKKEIKQKHEQLLELAIKNGDQDEILYYKLELFLELGDYCDKELQNCSSKQERREKIKWHNEYECNRQVYEKIDRIKIEKIMLQREITIDDISKYIGKTKVTVKKWIYGQSTPRVGTFIKLLEFLNCTKDEIIRNR